MQRRLIFPIFLLLAASSFCYFGVKFCQVAWLYTSLTKNTPAKVTRWDIEEERSYFAIWASYEYEHQGKILTARAPFPGPLFLNEAAAATELRAKAKEPLKAYYDPSSPTRSSLERAFPTGYGIRCILSFLILIYFLFLKKKLKSLFNYQ